MKLRLFVRTALLSCHTMYIHSRGLVHQGSTLKRRKHKSPNLEYYRNVKVQNEWLRENLFDPMGNYLICAKCICASLQISARRLTRQRLVKREQSQHPLVTMKKSEVTDKRLGQYVVMPASVDQSFLVWWRSLDDSEDVSVHFPHFCYEGPIEDSTVKLASGHSASEVAIPDRTSSYKSSGLVKSIASTKMAHLTQMYNNFIPSESRLNFFTYTYLMCTLKINTDTCYSFMSIL